MNIKNGDNGQMSNELKIAVGAMEIADKVVENVMTKLAVSLTRQFGFGLLEQTISLESTNELRMCLCFPTQQC